MHEIWEKYWRILVFFYQILEPEIRRDETKSNLKPNNVFF